jgi:hypothetical protein
MALGGALRGPVLDVPPAAIGAKQDDHLSGPIAADLMLEQVTLQLRLLLLALSPRASPNFSVVVAQTRTIATTTKT